MKPSTNVLSRTARVATAATLFVFMAVAAAVAAPPGLVIVMLDTSGSTSGRTVALHEAAARVIRGTPENVKVGSITFDIEARKSPVVEAARRAEALSTLEGAEGRGAWTDPARAVDAAMSLAQQTGSDPVLVIFTDGRASLPPNFRDRSGFAEVLARELEAPGREYARCILVIVGPAQIKGLERLNGRVTVVRARSASELDKQVDAAVLPALSAMLKPAIPDPLPPQAPETTPKPAARLRFYLFALAAVVVLTGGLVVFIVWRRKRRAPSPALEVAAGDPAQEATSAAPPGESATADALVAIVRAAPQGGPGAGTAAARMVLRSGNRAVVGRSAFAAIRLEGLLQPETLEVRFEGNRVFASRLPTAARQEADRVEIAGQEAPSEFAWPAGAELRVGGYLMQVAVTTERQAEALMPHWSRSGRQLERAISTGVTPAVRPRFDL